MSSSSSLVLGFQTEYFPPDPSANAVLYGRLVKGLSSALTRIDVVTASPHAGTSGITNPRSEVEVNVRVNRCSPPSWRLRRFLGTRFLSEAWFAVRNTLRAAQASTDWDVHLCSTPPLLLGAGGSFVARLRGIPFVWWVQDLHPEIAVALRLTTERSLSYRLLHALHSWILDGASIVLAVSNAQREALLDAYPSVPPRKVVVLENPAAHTSTACPPSPRDVLTITYTGNLGLSQGLEHVLNVADRVRDLPVRFVLHGRGSAESGLRKLSSELGLENVGFSDLVSEVEYLDLLHRSDVLLLSLRPGIDRYSFPSKLWTYLAAGRPILAYVDSQGAVAETLRRTDVGVVATWGDVDSSVGALKQLLDSDRRRAMSNAARTYHENHIGPQQHVDALLNLLLQISGTHRIRNGER